MQTETDHRYRDAPTLIDAQMLMNTPIKTHSTATEWVRDWAGCLNSREKSTGAGDQIPINAVTPERFVEDLMWAVNDKLYSWIH